MASSFISYKEYGFWIHDGLMEIVAGFIYVELSKEKNKPDWLIDMMGLLKRNSLGYYASGMKFKFEDFLATKEKMNFFLELLKQIQNTLLKNGAQTGLRELKNEIYGDERGYWNEEIETDRLIKIIDYIKELLDGKLMITVSAPINYHF